MKNQKKSLMKSQKRSQKRKILSWFLKSQKILMRILTKGSDDGEEAEDGKL